MSAACRSNICPALRIPVCTPPAGCPAQHGMHHSLTRGATACIWQPGASQRPDLDLQCCQQLHPQRGCRRHQGPRWLFGRSRAAVPAPSTTPSSVQHAWPSTGRPCTGCLLLLLHGIKCTWVGAERPSTWMAAALCSRPQAVAHSRGALGSSLPRPTGQPLPRWPRGGRIGQAAAEQRPQSGQC